MKRYKKDASLIILDIDHFKRVNDTYGHLAGDNVLRDVAKIIKEKVRDSDMVARWGGEEFAIVLNNSDLKSSHMIVCKIKDAIEKHDFEKVGKLTVSCGIAQFMEHDNTVSLFEEADSAMYEAKKMGRNCICPLLV